MKKELKPIKKKNIDSTQEAVGIFDRVVTILEKAQSNVVKAVNSNMVIAYWMIGREIVNEIQNGKQRAIYGKSVIEKLSDLLTLRYKKGYSKVNLWLFRQFYMTYQERDPRILYDASREFREKEIPLEVRGESIKNDMLQAVNNDIKGFSPYLSWTHYRAIMRVENANERSFYEIEAEKERWDVKHLERQIHTFLCIVKQELIYEIQ